MVGTPPMYQMDRKRFDDLSEVSSFLLLIKQSLQMQVTNQTAPNTFKLTLSQAPLQNSMVNLSSNALTFSPRKKVSLQDDTQFNHLRQSLISSPSLGQISGKDLSKSQATFSFSPRAPISRENGGGNGAANGLASPIGKQFWSPRAQIKATNPESESKLQDKPQNANASWSLKKGSFQKDQIVKEVLQKVKDEHITPLFTSMKNEMVKNYSQLQRQLRQFKNETNLLLKKQENSIFELSLNQTVSSGLVKNTKYDQKISEIKTQLFVIETKFNQIEHQFLQKLKSQEKQLQKLSLDIPLHKNSIKSSPFKSSMPPLLLEYKQSFKIKVESTPRQFLINNTTYYIDKSGYLMDHQNYYLIDGKGMRIQLEEHHLQMLQVNKMCHNQFDF